MHFQSIKYEWEELFPFGPAPKFLEGDWDGISIQTMDRMDRMDHRYTRQGLAVIQHFPHRSAL